MRYLLLLMIVLCFTLSGAFAEPSFKYGISSMLSASNTFIYYEELNSYITDNLGVKSEIIHKENYSDMNKLIENQQVDFASICTGAHDKSIYLVNKGVVDAAAVDSIIYANLLRIR